MDAKLVPPQLFGMLRRFSADLVPHRLRIAGAALLSLVVAGLEVLRPWPIQWVFDGALHPTGEIPFAPRTVVWIGVTAVLVIAVLAAALQYAREIAVAEIGARVSRGLRHRIFSHLARLSPLYHARHKSGDLLVRLMGDVPMVTDVVVDSSLDLLARGVVVVGTVAVMLVIDPVLTLATFAIVPPLTLLTRWTSRRIHVAVKKQRRREGDLADYLHEAIAATETIQSLGGTDRVVERFAKDNRRTARAGLKAKRLAASLAVWIESMLGFVLAGVLLLGSLRVLSGSPDALSAGKLLVFVSYVRNLIKPVRSASKHAARIAKGAACGERIQAVLGESSFVASEPGAPSAPLEPRELAFEDVHFAYRPGVPALAGFSAVFRRGELSALVGRSGAGKSTAAALAQRLFDPDLGAIRLDGRSIAEFELDSLRERVGLALQRNVFFGESLRENLLLSRPDATDEEIWAALHAAGADEFVRMGKDGLDATLGSGGVGLSGGQLSRLALARTLLRRAGVVIVDEPFAGLDRAAVLRAAGTLRALAREKIVIVIAHDFEDLEVYDRVVFLDHGRKVDEGRHVELLERHPHYRQVVRGGRGVPA
jgi:ABC-type multidrug transport system fused ATPase/permease subunit